MLSAVAERRMTLRMLSYWEKVRKDLPMPVERDIDPDDLLELWDNCFLIHVKDMDKPDYNYTYLGQNIIDAYTHGMTATEADGRYSPNAGAINHNLLIVIETRKPLVEEAEFTNVNQETVKYRQCLLPLGENGKVDAILGVMGFKIFAS